MQVVERTEERYYVRENEFGEVCGWRFPERVVLEYNCRVRMILDGHAFLRREGNGVPECSACGGKFILTR